MNTQNAEDVKLRFPEILIKFQEGGSIEEDDDGRLIAEHLSLEKFYSNLTLLEGAEAYRSFRILIEKEKQVNYSLDRDLPSLDLFVRIRFTQDLGDLGEIKSLFEDDPEVEYASLPGLPGPPPATDDFSAQQNYLNPAPDGVDAKYAWTFPSPDGTPNGGGDGTNINVCVCEYDLNPNHEDLPANIQIVYPNIPSTNTPVPLSSFPINPNSRYAEHGTQTMGVLGAIANGKGVTGISHNANLLFGSTLAVGNNPRNIRDCITAAGNALNAGDVLVLEMQVGDSQSMPPYKPWEFNSDVHAAISILVKEYDIVVIAAAGNSDLDLTQTQNDRGDYIWQDIDQDSPNHSGSIIVGAGGSASSVLPLGKISSSNFGKRVDCQGWGNNVATTGGSDLLNSDESPPDDNYTNSYDGTSSATAIVAGVVACMQGVAAKSRFGRLSPQEIRRMLRNDAFGSPQQNGFSASIGLCDSTKCRIGPLPDLSLLLPAIAFRRDPINLELVMDSSNSMNNMSPSDPNGDSKLELMKQATSIVTDFINDHGQDSDKMGLIWFSDDAIEYQNSMGEKLVSAKLNHLTLKNQIESQGTGICTAMGAGLQTAFNTLSTSAQKPFIILCTDGMQNIEPLVEEVNGHLEIKDNSNAFLCGNHSNVADQSGVDITTYNARIHTIGVGITATYSGLLQTIANETNGFYRGTNDPENDLDLAYLLTLCNCMAGGSPAITHHAVGRLTRDKTRAHEVFFLNRSARKMTIILSWKKAHLGSLIFWLYGPDGTFLQIQNEIQYFDSYCLATIRLPFQQDGSLISHVGKWRMLVCGEMQRSVIDYHAFVIVDDHEISFQLDYDKSKYEVGDILPLRTNLSTLGKPFLGINDLSIESISLESSISDLFAQFTAHDYELLDNSRNQSDPYQNHPILLKLQKMSFDSEFKTKLKPNRELKSLFSDNFNCEITSDGIVTPIDLLKPGLHTFKVNCHSDIPNNGPVSRVDMLSVFVYPGNFSKKQSIISTVNVSDSNLSGIRLFITPRNKFGQLFGPGYKSEFTASFMRKSLEIEVDDLLNGMYQISIMFSDEEICNFPKTDGEINLRFQGKYIWKGDIRNSSE